MHWVLPRQKQIQCKFKQNMCLSESVSSDNCARTRYPQIWPELSIWRRQVAWWVNCGNALPEVDFESERESKKV